MIWLLTTLEVRLYNFVYNLYSKQILRSSVATNSLRKLISIHIYVICLMNISIVVLQLRLSPKVKTVPLASSLPIAKLFADYLTMPSLKEYISCLSVHGVYMHVVYIWKWSSAHALGASVVWHHSLLLMNSFNKTETAVFSCRLCFLRAFPFISLICSPSDERHQGWLKHAWSLKDARKAK